MLEPLTCFESEVRLGVVFCRIIYRSCGRAGDLVRLLRLRISSLVYKLLAIQIEVSEAQEFNEDKGIAVVFGSCCLINLSNKLMANKLMKINEYQQDSFLKTI